MGFLKEIRRPRSNTLITIQSVNRVANCEIRASSATLVFKIPPESGNAPSHALNAQ